MLQYGYKNILLRIRIIFFKQEFYNLYNVVICVIHLIIS